MAKMTGWHVLGGFVAGYAVIIGVNLTLAFNAVSTFPGLEVKNSYVASQSFDAERRAQEALGWTTTAQIEGGALRVQIRDAAGAVMPQIERALFGRPTRASEDQDLVFVPEGGDLVAPVTAGPGTWMLKLEARAEDGTLYRQRLTLRAGS